MHADYMISRGAPDSEEDEDFLVQDGEYLVKKIFILYD